MIRVLLINNYDSFVYNILQILNESGVAQTTIVFNDQLIDVDITQYDKVVISPGPGIPSEAGTLLDFIEKYKEVPMFGICLGFQAIGEVFGATLYPLSKIYHGHQSQVEIISPSHSLFFNIQSPFQTGRYHSWALSNIDFPKELIPTSKTEDGIIMSFIHAKYPITATLFHPESIMTPDGNRMIRNWLSQ